MHYSVERVAESVQRTATVDQPHGTPRLLYAGHFLTQPGYCTIRRHGTQDWLLFFTLKGTGRIVHLDGVLHTVPGECVILPPGLPHDYRIAEDCDLWEFLWTHFIPWPHWLALLAWPQRLKGLKYLPVASHRVRARIRDSLIRMVRAASGPMEEAELFAMNALEEALLWLSSAAPRTDGRPVDARVQSAMHYLCENFGRKVTIQQVGEHCGLSSSRLSHLFPEQVGLTPIEYLEQQRIRKARELLEISSFTVSQIAYQTGYESPFYFSRRFSKVVGVSPKEYRRVNGRR